MKRSSRPDRILIVEDDPEYARILRRRLRLEGHVVESASHGQAGLFKLKFFAPDLILLDMHMPGTDGIALYKALRRAPQTRGIPVILITGQRVLDSLLDAAAAGLGAEPVFHKLDGLDDLAARVAVRLRQAREAQSSRGSDPPAPSPTGKAAPLPSRSPSPSTPEQPRRYELDGLLFFPDLRRLTIDGKPVKLNNKEAALFELLIRRPGMPHASDVLWEAAWPGSSAEGWRHTLKSRISTLRKKLGKKWGDRLVSQKNEGYALTVL